MSFQRLMSNPLFINFFGVHEKGGSAKDILINYIIIPINNGLIGFAAVFTVIISVRFSEKLFTGNQITYVSLNDLAIASIGLLSFGAGRILLNIIYSISKKFRKENSIH